MAFQLKDFASQPLNLTGMSGAVPAAGDRVFLAATQGSLSQITYAGGGFDVDAMSATQRGAIRAFPALRNTLEPDYPCDDMTLEWRMAITGGAPSTAYFGMSLLHSTKGSGRGGTEDDRLSFVVRTSTDTFTVFSNTTSLQAVSLPSGWPGDGSYRYFRVRVQPGTSSGIKVTASISSNGTDYTDLGITIDNQALTPTIMFRTISGASVRATTRAAPPRS